MNNIFIGPFKTQLNSYYKYKISLGYKLESELIKLKNFDEYTYNNKSNKLSLDLIYKYMNTKNIKQNSKASIISVLRKFIEYLYNKNECDFIIPKRIYRRKDTFIPHIFTNDEINKFFLTAKDFYPDDEYKNRIINLCFKLLYCTGMRISECLNLKFSDVNFSDNSIIIYNTKNYVDRRIIINDKLIDEIKYLKNNYSNIIYENDNGYIFINRSGKRYTRSGIYSIFTKIIYYSGIEKGPRIHSFRHTYCVRGFQKIFDCSDNYFEKICTLSIYVGHKNLVSTEYYLRLTAELYPKIREKIEKYSNNIIIEMEDYNE